MKKWCLISLWLASLVCGEDLPPVSVKFSHSGVLSAQKGEPLTFGCEINRNLAYLANNTVYIIRYSAIEESEHIVSETPGNLNKDTNYSVSSDPVPGNGVLINIGFHVRDLDEGTFICRTKDENGTLLEAKLDIQINKPVEHLYLNFLGNLISETEHEPLEVSSGNYTVACIADGSNPAPSVHLYFNGREVKIFDNQTEKLETKLRQYKTTINASVPIRFWNSVQEIKCNASTQLQDIHSVAVNVKTEIQEPEVNCSNSEAAYEGQRHPVLTCTIMYEGVNITNYTYADGDHTVKFSDVKIEHLSETEIRVYLKLDVAKDWHFRDFDLLLTRSDGGTTREFVKLRKATGAPASSTKVRYFQMAILLPFASWLFLYS